MFPVDNLSELQQRMYAAHLRHAARPHVLGPFSEAFSLWRKHYEARAALADQNPTFAAKLLRMVVPPAPLPLSLPLVPAGIYWAIDQDAPNTIVLTASVAGSMTLAIVPPPGVPVPAIVATPGATRQAASFLATADGLYAVTVFIDSTRVATVYIPVQRGRFRDFRELSRALAFDFTLGQNPVAGDDYTELLAVLYAADAAAATGQPVLFGALAAVADDIAKAPHPIALFPRE